MTTWAVTGATGFIGLHLCRELRRRGHQVTAIVRSLGTGTEELRALGAELRVADLANGPDLAPVLSGADVCVHLAAPRRTLRRRGASLRLDGFRQGDQALLAGAVPRILDAGAREGLTRLVLASSTAVFGHPWAEVSDRTPSRPDTPYGQGRLAGELAAGTWGRRLGIATVCLRLSEVVGPGSGSHGPLFERIAQGRFRVLGDGSHPHQVLAVSDAVRALIAAGESAEAANRTMIVSGPRISLRQWVDQIAAAADARVRYLSLAGVPSRVALRSIGWLPISRGSSRRLAWDYLLRPRAYDTRSSEQLLGRYHRADLGEEVREAMAWYESRAFHA